MKNHTLPDGGNSSSAPQQSSRNDLLFTIHELRTELASLRKEHHDLQHDYLQTVKRLVLLCEHRDAFIESHIARLSRYCWHIAERMGMKPEEIAELELTAPMHDIGKIGVSEEILLKPGKLSELEFCQMKLHTVIGGNILSKNGSSLLTRAREIALYHHENWDGTGYPIGLKNSNIPIVGRIVRLMDEFDALTSQRPHKMPYPVDYACDFIHLNKGKKFDPDLVEVLEENLDGIIKIKADIDSPGSLPSNDFRLSERDRN
jgi:putative two-component system response regulator